MTSEELELLRSRYAGRMVKVNAQRPELARFVNLRGRVVTINCNGRALVQFEDFDPAWYAVEPEYLKIIEPAAEPPAEKTPQQQ